jgi:long-chain-fatty-acid--CoA ligase ACSBG
VTWTAATAGKHAQLEFGKEVVVSYLPLSHIAAQLLDMYFPLCFGGTVYFAKPDALKVWLQ